MIATNLIKLYVDFKHKNSCSTLSMKKYQTSSLSSLLKQTHFKVSYENGTVKLNHKCLFPNKQ